jgi:hypothetical protein
MHVGNIIRDSGFESLEILICECATNQILSENPIQLPLIKGTDKDNSSLLEQAFRSEPVCSMHFGNLTLGSVAVKRFLFFWGGNLLLLTY